MPMKETLHEVIIIGGGPAGLSAALMLGRCGRSVLVIDANEPRNGAASALHGYLTRDGVTPQALRTEGRADLRNYPSVTLREGKAQSANREADGFQVSMDDEIVRSRLLLLATGRVDPVPPLPGFAEFFGRGVFHCPYCDGWENRGRALGVFGRDREALDLARTLLTWSRDVTIYSPGASDWPAAGAGPVRVVAAEVVRLDGGRRLERVILRNGFASPCDALFFPTPCAQRSDLPQQLGCRLDADDSVRCAGHAAEGVDGLFVAGNVRGGVHLAITAAAEGAEAAIVMNRVLAERGFPWAPPSS
jgi:thioredoxin reductase